jgi:prepilin-type N-terminal cleavage/methylation domain-containing protein
MTTPLKGFTLVETMVAISLLAVALVGPYVAVQNAVQGSYVARDQLIASQLAQEGVEYVRGVRDNNYHHGRSWLYGFNDSARDGCYGGSPITYCTVDPTQGDFNNSGSSGAMAEVLPAASATSSAPYLKV